MVHEIIPVMIGEEETNARLHISGVIPKSFMMDGEDPAS